MSQTRLLFVRHCDVHNPDDVVYGRIAGFGLSAKGRAQAVILADYLASEAPAIIYRSPQLRARQTAAAIATRHPGVPIYVSQRLNEVRTSYQGLRHKDIPKEINEFDNPKDPSDETIVKILRRMQAFTSWLCQRYAGKSVISVSHASPIAILRAGIEGWPLVVKSLEGPEAPTKGSVTTFTFSADDTTPTITYTDVCRSVAD